MTLSYFAWIMTNFTIHIKALLLRRELEEMGNSLTIAFRSIFLTMERISENVPIPFSRDLQHSDDTTRCVARNLSWGAIQGSKGRAPSHNGGLGAKVHRCRRQGDLGQSHQCLAIFTIFQQN